MRGAHRWPGLRRGINQLEATAGADDDLLALKRKMGSAPPEAPKATPLPAQVRVEGQAAPAAPPEMSKEEQDELATALAQLEAEEQRDQARMKR